MRKGPGSLYDNGTYPWSFVTHRPPAEVIELDIKDATDTDRSASYIDLHLEIDSEGGRGYERNFTIKEMISMFLGKCFKMKS
jgi:hypothetical protein